MATQVCSVLIKENVAEAHAPALWEALMLYLDGTVPFTYLTYWYQLNSDYVPFLECMI